MNLIKKNTFPNYSNIYRDVNYKPFEKSKVFKKGINQIEQNSVDDNIFNRIMNNNKRLSKMIIDDCSKFDLNRPVLSFKDEKCSFMKKKEWIHYHEKEDLICVYNKTLGNIGLDRMRKDLKKIINQLLEIKKRNNVVEKNTIVNKNNYKNRDKAREETIVKTINFDKSQPKKEIINHKSNEDNYYEEKETKKSRKMKKILGSALLLFGIFLFLIIFIIYATLSTVNVQEIITINDNETINQKELIPINISYGDFFNSKDIINDKKVLNGFLEHKMRSSGSSLAFHEFFIVDDYNQSIILEGKSVELGKIVSIEDKSEKLYSLYGTLTNFRNNLKLKVDKIESFERKTTEIIRPVNTSISDFIIINITQPRFPIIRSIVYNLLGKSVVCDDGTLLNNCSQEEPFVCTIFGLEKNPSKCGCPSGMREYKDKCIIEVQCSDGTFEPECSDNFKMQCIDSEFVYNPSECGCPEGYVKRKNTCIKTCSDKTVSGDCSSNKPYQCIDGILIEKSDVCGCPFDYVKNGNSCISKYLVNPKNNTYTYILNGKRHSFQFVVYSGLNDYLSNIERSISYTEGESPPDTREFIMKDLNNNIQSQYLDTFVEKIVSLSSDNDTQAKIAISIIQNIPYDDYSVDTYDIDNRYPYEVLYDNTGVCGEKSNLLIYLLRELGFGVVAFEFNFHRAVGVSCNELYDNYASGYCFVESTTPSIITDSQGDYRSIGRLSAPEIIVISSGNQLNVSEEYSDFREYNKILSMGSVLDEYYYNKWYTIVNKYGLEVEES